MTVHTHSASGYKNGCRCQTCREAFRDWMREYTHRTGRNRPRAVAAAARMTAEHGTETRYTRRGDGCRCDACREAARLARARRRAARRQVKA